MPVLQDGQIFERYHIIKWLGKGSSGESYEAEDKMLLRKTTLKLIHPWTTLPDSVRRQFFRDMQGLSLLNHRFLAPVVDYGEIDGRIYAARRYVSNGSLLSPNGRAWFRPPLAIPDAFFYTHQLAQALHFIHQHGYIHGSLTFANVLVLHSPNMEQTEDYAPFLLADAALGNFVRRSGKPGIEALPVSAAPEQIHKRTTPASDQFALAVLLYFWLTGRPPYLGTPAEVEQQKLTKTISPLQTLNPGVTAEQDNIILRALAVHPEERHSSTLAFAEALLATLASLPRAQLTTNRSFRKPPETPLPVSYPLETNRILSTEIKPISTPEQVPQLVNEVQLASAIPEPPVQASPSMLEQLLTSLTEDKSPGIETTSFQSQSPALSLPEIPETPEPEVSTQQSEAEPDSEKTPVSEDASSQAATITPEIADDTPIQTGDLVADMPIPPLTANPVMVARIEMTIPPAYIADAPPTTQQARKSTSPLTDSTLLTPRLIVSPPYATESYEFLLTNPETNIGRAGASDLLLDQDNLASRHHAIIKCIDERVLIFDKRSNNGVFVNGQQINVEEGYELVDGDHIGIGNYELIFHDTPASNISD